MCLVMLFAPGSWYFVQTVIAERTSYFSVDGSVLPDGKGRKVSKQMGEEG